MYSLYHNDFVGITCPFICSSNRSGVKQWHGKHKDPGFDPEFDSHFFRQIACKFSGYNNSLMLKRMALDVMKMINFINFNDDTDQKPR